jgi:ATP adenylyltransferase
VKKKPPAMEWLWAPWRMPYIRVAAKEDAKSACFFCDYAAAPKKDGKNLVVKRGSTAFAVLNRYPYTGGHLMVAPFAHKGDLEPLTAAERAEIFDLAVEMEVLLKKVLKPHGFNLGINLGRPAGAGVPGHVDLHLVPRWNGDTNFMSAVGNVKVIPQALEELHGELVAAL